MQRRFREEQLDYHSFLVRIWRSEEGWSGEIEQIQTGESRRFAGLEELQELVRIVLEETDEP